MVSEMMGASVPLEVVIDIFSTDPEPVSEKALTLHLYIWYMY